MAANNTMRKVSLRNVLAHKLRLALTLLAVVLGTSFIAGSFMFTNSLSSTFDAAVSNAFSDVDAAVNGDSLNEEIRTQLAQDSEIANVNAESTQTVVVANKDAEAFQTRGGSASLNPYYPAEEMVGKPAEIVEGAAPQGTGEVIVNDSAAEKFGINVGDEIIVVHPDHRESVTVSGLFKPAVEQGEALLLEMDAPAFIELYGNPEQLVVSAAEGVSPEELVDHINATYPTLSAESGEKVAKQISDAISSALKFVNYFLIAFGLIALLVGTFIIANTFSMIVAQRTKEFALLRALGASRGQITRSVVFEAAIIGVIGSAVGVVAGIGLVAIIKAVLNGQGMPMGSSLGLSTSSVVVPIVLGTVVTVISAWAPARRAGAVKPVEAMRTTEQAAGSPLKVRTIIGVLLIAVGAGLAVACTLMDGSTGRLASLVGVGALAVIVGFFLASPALSLGIVPGLGRVIGAPFGAVGKLASTNSRRNPRRTATTAFALTLGVALVTAIGMLGATMKSSVADTLESNITADYILSGPTSGNFPTPAQTAQVAADTPGVTEVLQLSIASATVDGASSMDYGPELQKSFVVDNNPSNMISFDMAEGSADFDEGFLATTDFAAAHGWKVGQSYPLAVDGQPVGEIELKGIFEPNRIVENMVIASPQIPADIQTVYMVGVKGSGDNLRENLEASVKDLVVVQVMSGEEYAGEVASMINQMLAILYGLLALAVIIAILGIINTLTLGVIERRQEIGMLRAVGTQRRQIRTMITLEAVEIAIFGALAGVIIGLGLGWAFIDVLGGVGLDVVSIPWGQIAIMLLGSGFVGVFAALWPSHRAAKTPPLEAIAA